MQANNQNSVSSLSNEAEFAEQTQQLLEFSARTGAKATMLFITFNSQVGDINKQQNGLALDAISERLLSKARESDIYAHLDGINFANLSIATSDQHTAILIEKLKNELAEPFQLQDGSTIKLNAKVGSAESPRQGNSYEELIRNAKTATL
jgi:diguanylate cyclase (GGDEF)-like protein